MAATKKETQTKQETNDLIFEGVITKAFFGSDTYDKDEKYRVTIKSDNIPYTDITVFDESGSRFTPSWLKEMNGYINLKSNYEIPIRDVKGREISWDDWMEEGTAKGSEVRVKIRQKITRGNGAIYPVAIRILKPGIAEDPFEGM